MNHKTLNYILVIVAVLAAVNGYFIGYGKGYTQLAIDEKDSINKCMKRNIETAAISNANDYRAFLNSGSLGVLFCFTESQERLKKTSSQ
ncbi:hypothetical protein CAL7716_101730 (plasmid) [Calothrix sp. PCC 7716]|nr:hypothetical protein CAL7716_101730 [Calothrix sp. PCC 7716]